MELDRRIAGWATALGLTLLVAIFPQFGLGALGPQLRVDLGLSTAEIGLLFAGLYAAGVLGSPIAGLVVDRVGGRRSCLGLLLVAGGALLLASVVSSRDGLIIAMVPAGIAMAFANPGTTRWASAADDTKVQATLVAVAQAGVQAGALGAGLLASASAIGLDWRGAFRVGAGVAVIAFIVAWLSPADEGTQRSISPRRAPARRTPARKAPAHDGAASASTSPRTMQLALAGYAALMGAGTGVVFAYLPSFAADVGGLSAAAAGATATVFGATALIGRLSLSALPRRLLERVRPFLVVLSVGAVGAVVLLAATTVGTGWLWAGTVLFGATGTTWPALAFLGVIRASPPGTAGRVTGWITAAFYLGLWLTPPVAGQVITSVGYTAAWGLAAACYLVALVPLITFHEPTVEPV